MMVRLLILVPLVLVVFSGVFAQIVGSDVLGSDLAGSLSGSGSFDSNVGGTYNGTDVSFDTSTDVFTIDAEFGFMVTVAVTIGLLGALGFGLFGSGFDAISIKAIAISGFYFGMLGMFGVLASPLYASIPIWGTPLFIILTLVMALGVIDMLGDA